MLVVLICLLVALACFLFGAAGVLARVSWDQAGKAALVLAVLAHGWPWGVG